MRTRLPSPLTLTALSVLAALAFAHASGCGGSSNSTDMSSTGEGGATTTSSTMTSSSSAAVSSTTSGMTGGGGQATSSSGSGGAGGAGMQSGDCTTDKDCPGSKCVEITPGGYRVCLVPPVEVTMCMGMNGCCSSKDCQAANQKCYPSYGYCGGIVGPMNQCLADACMTDKDCKMAGTVCVAPGLMGNPVFSCIVATCKVDTDCKAQAGGKCAPVHDKCCDLEQLACVYPNGGCRKNSDCPGGYCDVDATGAAVCKQGNPGCPQ